MVEILRVKLEASQNSPPNVNLLNYYSGVEHKISVKSVWPEKEHAGK